MSPKSAHFFRDAKTMKGRDFVALLFYCFPVRISQQSWGLFDCEPINAAKVKEDR
jgi:hypothetical protein